MRHDPRRTVLENREQRHHIIAVASCKDDFIRGNNSKIHRAGADQELDPDKAAEAARSAQQARKAFQIARHGHSHPSGERMPGRA